MTTSQTNFFRTVLAFLLLLVILSWPLSSQSQSTTPSSTQSPTASRADAPASLRFEVASIRPRQFNGEEPSNRQMLPGGRFVATATTARTLIRIAFGAEDNRISGAPKWIDNEIFDINAITVNHDEVTTPQQFQQLMLSLLQDRFQLKFHREQIETAVYWLELVKPGKLGPDLKQSSPDSQPNMSTNSNGARTVMKISKMSMADIAAGLRRQSGRPVEDHTGLKGDFDFQIEWAPEENPDSADPSLFTVLKEQLGLRLRSAKGTAESIVIDQISLPSAN
jgi:uncharacterized protein (TIGR03435 family)